MRDTSIDLRFADLIERIDVAASIEDLFEAVASLRDVFDVEHAVYHSVDEQGTPYALATYGPEWSKHYEEEKLYLIDPVVRAAFGSFAAYDWKDLSWEGPRLERFRNQALEGGVGNQGFSLPIRGPAGEFAIVTLSNTATDRVWEMQRKEAAGYMVLAGHYIHEATRRLHDKPSGNEFAILSSRERDVLVLLSKGLNRAAIADRLDISEHTLRVYVDSARHKLGALNTTHAVALALKSGIISL